MKEDRDKDWPGRQMVRYPLLMAKLNRLSRALHTARDRHSDEPVRLSAMVQALVDGIDLLRVCRRVLPRWIHEPPELSKVLFQLCEVGVDHTTLKTHVGWIQNDASCESREAMEQIFRSVLDPQLGRIGRYRQPGTEYVLFRRRITNPNERLVVVWDDEIRLLCKALSDPERKRRQLSNVLARTTPSALHLIEDLIERITNDPESQLIPDTICQVEAYPQIGKRFFSTGTLDLHPCRHGLDNKREGDSAGAINQERERVAHDLVTMLIHDGLKLGWNKGLYSPPFASMRHVLEIILNGVTQLSPSALRVVLRYAYATTRVVNNVDGCSGRGSSQHARDVWICSLGGDEDTAPMIEGCVLDMLLKLRQLEQLYAMGVIGFVPDLWCVATFHSQAAENTYTKAGLALDRSRHTYHARLMIERLHAFVTTYFSDIAHRCRLIEFPSYASVGSARALFAAVWQRLPQRAALGAKFATFRGGVYDASHDRIAALFASRDGESGAYPVRHVFSNGLVANDHGNPLRLLRWAPMSTEPLFWITARMAHMEMVRNPNTLCADVASAYTTRGTPEERSSLPGLLHEIAFQQSRLSNGHGIHGQIGIPAPALYYRRTGEPTPGELATGGIALLTRLAEGADRANRQRLQQMCALYRRLEALPGAQPYPTFLAGWAERSCSGAVPPEIITAQVERMRSYLIHEATARSMLNFWLR